MTKVTFSSFLCLLVDLFLQEKFLVLVLFCFFETGFVCITTLAILELFIGQADLELAEICLSPPPKHWN